MSENAPLDIDIDLSDISTTIPLIADNTTALVRLQNITQSDRDGTSIYKWELRLVNPATSQDGGRINQNHPLYVNFNLSYDWMKQKMARFMDGFLGTGDKGNHKGKPERPRFNASTVASMLGREAYARIVVSKSKTSDYVGNDVNAIMHKDDLTVAQAA